MSEPEGVLLEWAWRGVERLAPHRVAGAPESCRGSELAALRTELDVFLAAVFDRRFEILPLETARRSRWALPWLRRAPWSCESEPVPATDGSSIHLPRALRLCDASSRARVRVMALALAARIERGSVAELPADLLARDLYWLIDGARVCAWLGSELPGLSRDLLAARTLDQSSRRAWTRPSPLEARAEQLAQSLLRGDPVPAPEQPRSLAQWACDTARRWHCELGGGYRGIAPVRHQGVAIDVAASALHHVRGRGAGQTAALPSRTVRMAAEALPDTPEGREAPWLVPGGDPLLSAEPTSRAAHPLDRERELDLETLAEELERFAAVPRVRSEHAVHEVLEADSARSAARLAGTRAADPAEGETYPEWDCHARRYRPDRCRVRERLGAEGDPAWAAGVLRARAPLLRALRSQAEMLQPRLEHAARQLDGDEIDLDAYVEHRAERLRARSGSERLYRSERRLRRDFAVALLIDASASTERSIAPGVRVLDLEKETALLFCAAASWLGDRCAVYAFASRGPTSVHVQRLKGFDEPHGPCVERRIAALEAGDCTRLGAALRHVQRRLSEQTARARLLLVLSDGRPSDDDGYDGRYGSEDTRRAVHEAVQGGLVPFGLSIQPDPDAHLDRVFGPTRYARLLTPSALPERLAAVYRELTRRC